MRRVKYLSLLLYIAIFAFNGCGSSSSDTQTPTTTPTPTPTNNAPTIDTSFSDIILNENNGTTNYDINISDADGDALTLAVESNDTSIITVTQNWSGSINQGTYAAPLDFNLTTQTNASGIAKIKITVSDNDTNATTSFDVNVTATSTLKKTGQTTSYANYDDGYYKKGVTPSYTRDSTNNTVTDNVTHLMWQDDATPATMTWSDAQTYCSTLSLGGYTDWRLPTRKELVGLSDYGRYSPAIDLTFQNTISNDYWSSTTNASNTSFAWIVYFDGGDQDNDDKTYSNYVRCVRAGQ